MCLFSVGMDIDGIDECMDLPAPLMNVPAMALQCIAILSTLRSPNLGTVGWDFQRHYFHLTASLDYQLELEYFSLTLSKLYKGWKDGHEDLACAALRNADISLPSLTAIVVAHRKAVKTRPSAAFLTQNLDTTEHLPRTPRSLDWSRRRNYSTCQAFAACNTE